MARLEAGHPRAIKPPPHNLQEQRRAEAIRKYNYERIWMIYDEPKKEAWATPARATVLQQAWTDQCRALCKQRALIDNGAIY